MKLITMLLMAPLMMLITMKFTPALLRDIALTHTIIMIILLHTVSVMPIMIATHMHQAIITITLLTHTHILNRILPILAMTQTLETISMDST